MSREASVSNKAFRVISLLRAIPREPKQITSRELTARLEAEGHKIDKRSVERYLSELTQSEEFGGMLKCNERSKPYGWSFRRDAELSMPGMDAPMAVTWDLVGRYMQNLLPDAAKSRLLPVINSARHWLKRHQPAGSPAWSKKVAFVPQGLQLLPAEVSPAVLETVYTALYLGKQLEIWYRENSSSYRVHPQALIDRGPVRYLVAPVWDHESPVLLALHRIKRAVLIDERSRLVPQFNLDEYVLSGELDMPVGKNIRVKLRFLRGAGIYLNETPISNDQKFESISEDESIVTATVMDSMELFWWLLGFGSSVEVISPLSLRERVRKEISDALSAY